MYGETNLSRQAAAEELRTLIELVATRAEQCGERVAYTFVSDRDDRADSITYAALDQRARALATCLQQRDVAGRPVMLLCPPGIDYVVAFLGTLYAGAIAVPAYPPDPNWLTRMLPRLESIVRDCRPTLALTTANVSRLVPKILETSTAFAEVEWIAVDDAAEPSGLVWREPSVGANSIAFLQYTSGSTADPKGVIVTHGNLLQNLRQAHVALQGRPDMVSWLPPYHDMGLIGGILQPLYASGHGWLLAPMTFLRRPFRWLETLSRTRCSTSVAPNFAYDLCVRKITDEELGRLDLSSWSFALCGAEPVRAETLDAFARRFAAAGFRRQAFLPCYGLAEATLMVSGHLPVSGPRVRRLSATSLGRGLVKNADGDGQVATLVGCGRAVTDTRITIVDPATRRRTAPGSLGEVWVHGPSVARGYWRRPELSADTFRARVEGDGEGLEYLRTGDLGFLDDTGELYLAGRLKDVIIVRGRNLYPQDLELAGEQSHPGLRPGASTAFGFDVLGQEEVVVVHEVATKSRTEVQEVLAKVREALARDFGVTPHAVVLVRAGSVPKTTSGKVQRAAARAAFEDLSLEVVAASITLPESSPLAAVEQLEATIEALHRAPAAAHLAERGMRYANILALALHARNAQQSVSLGSVLANPTAEQLLEALGHVRQPRTEPTPPATTHGASSDPPATTNGASAQPPATTNGATTHHPEAPLSSKLNGHGVLSSASATAPDAAHIEHWLAQALGRRLDLPAGSVPLERPFVEVGLDSQQAVSLAEELGRWLGRPVPPTLVWEAPTPRAAARLLAGEKVATAERQDQPREGDPIAIVGMACRFPGAPDLESFWKLLVDGRDAVREVPQERWSAELVQRGQTEGVSRWGGFLDRIDTFDWAFFAVSSREAQRMDPQQRLLLEVSWEALEHAGWDASRLSGSNTGVFLGISSQDYWTLQSKRDDNTNPHACTGSAHAIAANRVSYFFDFKGPSLAVDTACSSSLVALHLACESLRRGDCDTALVSGVNVLLTADLNIAFSRAGMLSPEGACKTFDESADGYVRGEGCGVVVLKRLSAALRDGDRVIATILGSAVRHDGRSNGLTAPNGSAQAELLEATLRAARVAPQAIGYVEAHGTGTPLGDPVELRVLSSVYGKNRADGEACPVASVKTNIGHLEAAAGIAGLIKSALAVSRGYIPPHLHLRQLTSRLDWSSSGLEVPTRGRPWTQTAAPRLAAASSFGFGGTIAHVIVGEAPAELRRPEDAARSSGATPSPSLLCLSARSLEQVRELGGRYRQHLLDHPGEDLRDLCWTASAGRAAFPERAAVVAADVEGLREALQALAEQQAHPSVVLDRASADGPSQVGLLFTGQGASYAGVARDLCDSEPVFRRVLERCDELVRPLGHSLLAVLTAAPAPELPLEDTRLQQPCLFALECALFELWRSWGIRPAAVLGHSLGEYAAAVAAGVFTLEQGMQLVVERARLMSERPGNGSMIACVGPRAAVLGCAAELGQRLSIAAVNAPTHVVLSGDAAAIEEVGKLLATRGIVVRPLKVSHAFHSAQMEGCLPEFAEALRRTTPQPPQLPFIGGLTGNVLHGGEHLGVEYFCRALREPVQFERALVSAANLGCRLFLEVGPGSTLLSFARQSLGTLPGELRAVPSLQAGRSARGTMVESLAKLWAAGARVDWDAFHAAPTRRRVALPSYPFAPSLCEIALPSSEPSSSGAPLSRASTGHELGASPSGAGVADLTAVLREQTRILHALADRLEPSAALGTPSAPTTASSPLHIERLVRDQLSRIGGSSAHAVPGSARLGHDLGFDSLLRIELDRALVRTWPGLQHADRKSLPEDPTLDQVVRFVTQSLGVAGAELEAAAMTPAASTAAPPSAPVIAESTLESFEEYRALRARLAHIDSVGANPYGRIHHGFNAAVADAGAGQLLNFAAFNYVGLSHHERVRQAAARAIETYGTSTSATPLLFGESPLHHQLEAEIAAFLGTESAIVFSSGHGTNVAVVGHLMGAPDLVVHDELIHDSAVRGAMLSGAKRRSFPHNDWQALDRMLTEVRQNFRRVLIIIEGIYSQDGDMPNLPAFIEVKKRHQALLMIDEAHSIGVLGARGRGLGERAGVNRADVDLWMGTLSKALGSCGGYIAASASMVEFLKFTTPLFIFSTGISPANAAAALEGIRVLGDAPERVRRVQQLGDYFRAGAARRGLNTGLSQSHVVPIIVGAWEHAIRISNELFERGINVMPIGYPAVDRNQCRLRFFVNYEHTEQDLDRALDATAERLARLTGAGNSSGPGSSRGSSRRGQPVKNTTSQPSNILSASSSGSGPSPAARTTASKGCDVLVTGATGFVGGHLVRRLLAEKRQVRVLARPGNAAALAGLPLEIVEGALEDREAVNQAVRGARLIFNCAGLSSDWAAWSSFEAANVIGVRNLLEAVQTEGRAERLLHLSTSDVYGYPERAGDETSALRDVGLPYNRSKIAGETALWHAHQQSGVPVTVFRPVTIYGPGSKDWVIEIARLLLRKQMLLIDGGQAGAGLVYVDNLIAAMLAAVESPITLGQAYNIRDSGGETWRQYVDALAEGLGVPSRPMNLSSTLALQLARASEAVYGGLRVKRRPLLTRHAVYILSRDQNYGFAKAQHDFGFGGGAPFEQGLGATLAWLQSPPGKAALA